MTRIEYQAGVASCWVENGDEYFEYNCGFLQKRRIKKSIITSVGISDDTHVTEASHIATSVHEMMGTKGSLLGLLIAYRESKRGPVKLATITLDSGNELCEDLVNDVVEEFKDQFVGKNTRGALMKEMGVSRLNENLLIVLMILALIAFATIMTFYT